MRKNTKNVVENVVLAVVVTVIITIGVFAGSKIITYIDERLNESKEPQKEIVSIVYEVYRENNDGTYTKWILNEKPHCCDNGFVWWKLPNGETTFISRSITIIPTEIKTNIAAKINKPQ